MSSRRTYNPVATGSIEQTLQAMSEKFNTSLRSRILHISAEIRLSYENVNLSSQDWGLECWLILVSDKGSTSAARL